MDGHAVPGLDRAYGRNVAYEALADETTEAVVKSVFKQMKAQYKGRNVRPATK